MKYMIVEDEALLSANLATLIAELRPDWELVHAAESVEDTLDFLRVENCDLDLIFMDIRLSDGLCFDIFDEMDVPVPVIFTTAYNDYMQEAFKALCVDYLLKPVTKAHLSDSLDRFETNTKALEKKFNKKIYPALKAAYRNRILINSEDGYKIIPVDNIAYFLSQGKYVLAVLTDGSQELTDFNNLPEIQESVDPAKFFPASRNIIVSINAIKSVTKHLSGRLKLEVTAGRLQTEVFVSIARKKQFLAWLEGVEP